MDYRKMEAVAISLGLEEFDLLIVADGSGMVADRPCGWASCLWEPPTTKVWQHLGGNSGGTNNHAELAPFVQALFHWETVRRPLAGKRKVRAELVSDSEVTVRCGTGQYQRRANGPLWASIDWFVANGYELGWHHIPRCSNAVARSVDRAGREVRVMFEKHMNLSPERSGG